MKNIIIAIICVIAFNSSLISQSNIDSVLTEIEKNNTTLSAMQKRAEAEKIGNKTGIQLYNPEAELNYLWGDPSAIGNRTDFSLKQTFDFPTAYRHKNKISSIKNEQVDLEYQKQRKELLLESRLTCYDLVYTNALMTELSKRFNHAQSIANSYKAKFEAGEANILEYNKAQLNLLNLSKEIELLNIEREALLSELTRLNGGNIIDFTESEFEIITIPVDFEQWYQQAEQSNPLLNWLKKEIEISKKKISLSRAKSLPKFQVGYMSEKFTGQSFRGFSIGVSIPLWENKNTIKYSKANAIALEDIAADKKLQLYSHLKILHKKAIELQNSSVGYKSKLQSFDNSELLKKTLDKGQITLVEYILELSIYYNSVQKLLELEKGKNKAMAELNQYL